MTRWTLHHGDALDVLRSMPDASANCCVTSPPYWGLRDYGHNGQIGLEQSPTEYVDRLVAVFREVRRVLRDDGTLWLNLGDSYAATTRGSSGKGAKQVTNKGTVLADRTGSIPVGLKPKDLVGIPWRVAFALQADGWYLRSDIIWSKPNPMPESVKDRPTKAHEYVFLLSKSERYWYDADAVREKKLHPALAAASRSRQGDGRSNQYQSASGRDDGSECVPGAGFPSDPDVGRNRRTVWTVTPQPFKGAHFATMPPALVDPCIRAGCQIGGVVLDPFNGSGTTGAVAVKLQRRYVGIELNAEYIELARARIADAEREATPVQPALAIGA